MNAVASPTPTTATKIQAMQVLVKGRVEATRRYEQTRFTRLIAPASDPYSRPQTVEIRSKSPIGQRGEEVTVLAQLGGYTRKPYPQTDKASGEITMVTPVDLTLDAIE